MSDFDVFLGIDTKLHIYNSYNLEKEMASYLLKDIRCMAYVESLERVLVKESDLVFAISEEEKNGFLREYEIDEKRIVLVKNGFDDAEYGNRKRDVRRNEVLFIGSAHPPNLEAVLFINEKLAPSLTDCVFRIAGLCCSAIKKKAPNVILEGEVDQDRKDELLATTDVAINPMFHGSGTNLKMIEYLALGIPTVTTKCGARGLDLTSGQHVVVSDQKNFAEDLRSLIQNKDLKKHISKLGSDYVRKNFSWRSIAKFAREQINQVKRDDNRETLLVLNDFSISNPNNGGASRINGLYSALSAGNRFKIIYLCFNDRGILRKKYINDNFIEISIPKTLEHISYDERYGNLANVSVADVVSSFMAKKNKLYMQFARDLSIYAKLVIISHPYLYPIAEKLNKKIILESHNCEYQLKEKIFEAHPFKDNLLKMVQKLENSAARNSEAVVCVSQKDKEYFSKLNGSVYVVNNGFSKEEDSNIQNALRRKWKTKLFGKKFVCVFIASDHMPNMLGLKYLCNTLAPKLPEIDFVVVGRAGTVYSGDKPENVHFAGVVNETTKKIIFSCSDIAISLTKGGGGSSVKVADYLSYGLPIIANKDGVRGWNLVAGKEVLIIDERDPVKVFKQMISGSFLRKTLSHNGLKYFEQHCSWSKVARNYGEIIANVINHA
ncbi:MAG: glycosyltransferase family 4 protein [Patescibacteria group bacterium]